MHKKRVLFSLYVLITLVMFTTSGCTLIFQKGRRKDLERINNLKNENSKLQDQLSDLERAKQELEDRLKKEIDNDQVKVDMSDRGLVVTFLAEVLFDSGKAELKSDSLEKLEKVARVLNTTVRDLNVGIEGHTDNVPIKYSGWKDNWELSCQRALSVVRYLINDQGMAPTRLSAVGWGEFHPVETNDTPEGRQRNRRVEIVIYPKTVKEKAIQKSSEGENLK